MSRRASIVAWTLQRIIRPPQRVWTDWRVLNEAPRPASAQMARDVELAREPVLTLRVFRWDPPAISLGWKQPRPAWLDGADRSAATLDIVERPTGGGIAFHGSDVSVSVIVPRALNLSLDFVMCSTTRVAAMLCRSYGIEAHTSAHERHDRRVTYCLAEASSYAVWIGARKVAGFSVRRYPQTWLIHGSLFVQPLPEVLVQALPQEVLEPLTSHAASLSDAVGRRLDPQDVAQRWADHWTSWWDDALLTALEVVG